MNVVEQTSTTLVLQEPLKFWWSGLVFLAGGLVMAAFGRMPEVAVSIAFGGFWLIRVPKMVTCTFDKDGDRVTLEEQRLLGKKTTEHSLQQVQGVEYHSRVYLKLADDQRLPLTPYAGFADPSETAERIAEFLQVQNYGENSAIR